MKPSEILQTALDKLGPNGENWVNHYPYREEGKHCVISVMGNDPLRNDYDKDLIEAKYELFSVIKGDNKSLKIFEWNDAQTEFGPIKAAFEKAISLAKENEK